MVRILSFVLRKCTKNKSMSLQSQCSVYSFALPSSLHSCLSSSLSGGGGEGGKSADDSADDGDGEGCRVVVGSSDEEGMYVFNLFVQFLHFNKISF